MKKLLFIHRSVGHHLIEQGELRGLLENKGIALDDYDNNSGILTQGARELKDVIAMPGHTTNPDNLAQFFTDWPDVLNGYDIIMIKSCYPNSHIKSKAQLTKMKDSYSSIIKSFAHHNTRLVIVTSPPLRPLLTNKTEAQLASELAHWLVSLSGEGVQIFDFHHLLSENEGEQGGMLRREYRRLLPFDNHPNKKAHRALAPKLVEMIAEFV